MQLHEKSQDTTAKLSLSQITDPGRLKKMKSVGTHTHTHTHTHVYIYISIASEAVFIICYTAV